MKKSRLLAAALAGVLSLSLLAGCGPTASENSPAPSGSQPAPTQSGAPATEPSAESVNIVFAGWSGEEEATKDIFQRMMDTYEQQSGNTVTWVGWTWADTAQQLLIRSQNSSEQLDLAQADIGIFNTVAQAGVLADWNEILGED